MNVGIEDLIKNSAHVITIESEPKMGKLTFSAFLVNNLLNTKALLFTPQETYLFERRLKIFEQQFPQLSSIQENLNTFYLKTDWHHLKQQHGYDFFLQELVRVIKESSEKIIIFHRFGEFFEFQDRYEIEPIFRALVKLAEELGKKLFFLTNTKNENFEFIKNITEEFADVIIDVKVDEQNRRQIFIKDMLANQNYMPYTFSLKAQKFTLEKYEDLKDDTVNEKKRILIANLASKNDESLHLCEYILNYTQQFDLHYADSFQKVLKEVFVAPDLIVMLMSRSDTNFETIAAIKKHLKDVKVVVILDQDFLRAEDKRTAFNLGCDELFHSRYVIDELIMSFEKLVGANFYENRLLSLEGFSQVLHSKDEMKNLERSAQENALFYTLFSFDIIKNGKEKISSSGRRYDFIFQEGQRLFCIAINTHHSMAEKIIENYKRKGIELSLDSALSVLDMHELRAAV